MHADREAWFHCRSSFVGKIGCRATSQNGPKSCYSRVYRTPRYSPGSDDTEPCKAALACADVQSFYEGVLFRYAFAGCWSREKNASLTLECVGRAIAAQQFQHWHCDPETLLLAALLHDIGAAPANQKSTLLSFEFLGGIIALDLLKSQHAETAQAEAVCEAIIRHQDLGDTGNITTLTAIIHFATVLDNVGFHSELIAEETIEDVVNAFPRNGWSGCFASVVREECKAKPWANTTRIEGFADKIEANTVMRPYENQ